MDEIIVFVFIVIAAALLLAVLVAGLGVIIVLAVVAGILYLLFLAGKQLLSAIGQAQEDARRRKEEAAKREQLLAEQAKEEADRQERQRLALEEERARQREADLQRIKEETARGRLEAERGKADESLQSWTGGLLTKRPADEEIDVLVNDACRLQSHCGRHLLVNVAVNHTGVALEWKAHMASGAVPQIVGMRGTEEMFREWAFAGRHAARLPAGRYVLTFWVNQGGQSDRVADLDFEVFVPEQAPARDPDRFKRAVDATAKEFIDRTMTVAEAKRRVSEALDTAGADADEAAVELSKLESELSELGRSTS